MTKLSWKRGCSSDGTPGPLLKKKIETNRNIGPEIIVFDKLKKRQSNACLISGYLIFIESFSLLWRLPARDVSKKTLYFLKEITGIHLKAEHLLMADSGVEEAGP